MDPKPSKPTPKILDKQSQTNPTPKNPPNVTDDADVSGSQIIFRERYTNPETGNPEIREHGPMPVSEWATYEKEHGL